MQAFYNLLLTLLENLQCFLAFTVTTTNSNIYLFQLAHPVLETHLLIPDAVVQIQT